MADVLTDLKSLLTSYGFATTVQLSRLEDTPDAALAMRTYSGGPNKDLDGRSLPVLNSLAVQVIARAGKDAGVAAAQAIANQAFQILAARHATLPLTGGGTKRTYDWIKANQRPYHLGFDENDRPLVVFNLTIQQHGDLTPPTPAP